MFPVKSFATPTAVPAAIAGEPVCGTKLIAVTGQYDENLGSANTNPVPQSALLSDLKNPLAVLAVG